MFGLALDTLWFARNQYGFENLIFTHSDIMSGIQNRVYEAIDLHGHASKLQYGSNIIKVGWDPPPIGWVKINSDGFVNLGNAACGGLLPNTNGIFMVGFACNLGA